MNGLVLTGLSKRFGSVDAVAAIDLELLAGKFVCFLGPSGCGKTTLLRLIAGLEAPSSGSIVLDGRDITDVPTHKRDVGMVFQTLALFPHLTVQDNITYGLKLRGVPAAQRKERADELLRMIHLPDIGHRQISQLSGGQRQRVAIARALTLDPKLFLLDEPLSALDANLRQEMQVELKKLQKELDVTAIMVTHDQNEAMTVADIIVVMNGGRIEQIGPPLEVYRYPRTRFVAGFVGTNNLLAAGVADKNSVSLFGRPFIVEDAMPEGVHTGREVTISIRPEEVRLHGEEKPDAVNTVPAVVTFVRDLGFEVEAYVQVGDQQVISKWAPIEDPVIVAGDTVHVEFPPRYLRVLLQ